MSSDWEDVRLEEVTSILGDGLHGTPIYDDDGDYYFINGSNLRNGSIVTNNTTKRVAFCEFDKHKKQLNNRTIFVSINGTLGNVAVYNGEKVVLGKSICYFNVLESVDRNFVRYIVAGNLFQNYISNLATGSTIKNVSLRLMRDFSFKLPPLEIQKSISEILQRLDDRITLLYDTNANLESIAQALFKSWFVDFDPVRAKAEGREPDGMNADTAALFPAEFVDSALGQIPKGWSQASLSELTELNARSWTVRRAPAEVVYIDLASVKANVFDKPQRFLFVDSPSRARRELRAGDTIVGTVRPGNRSFGFIAQSEQGLTASTGFAVLSPRTSAAVAFTYLCATRDENIERLSTLADGGAYPAVRPEVVLSTSCSLPSHEVMAAFNSIAEPLLNAVAINAVRAQLLAEVRDTLLPQLISGKLRLPEADEQMEEVFA